MSDVEPDDHPGREAVVDAAVRAVTSEMAEMDGVICTFDDLFAAMNADLANPLPTLITPLQSPVCISDEEELLQLHPSPVSSLEEPSMAADKDITSTPAQTQSKRELSLEKMSHQRRRWRHLFQSRMTTTRRMSSATVWRIISSPTRRSETVEIMIGAISKFR